MLSATESCNSRVLQVRLPPFGILHTHLTVRTHTANDPFSSPIRFKLTAQRPTSRYYRLTYAIMLSCLNVPVTTSTNGCHSGCNMDASRLDHVDTTSRERSERGRALPPSPGRSGRLHLIGATED